MLVCSQKRKEQSHLPYVSRDRPFAPGADRTDTHKWTIFVTSATSPPPKEGDVDNINYLPGGADDLGYVIKRITFKLHDTYSPASRGE